MKHVGIYRFSVTLQTPRSHESPARSPGMRGRRDGSDLPVPESRQTDSRIDKMPHKQVDWPKKCSELEVLLKEERARVRYYQDIALEAEEKRLREVDELSRIIANSKRPDRALGESEEKYRTVVEASPDPARKKLEAQLQQAQKMQAIGTLAGGIAHDFNNLLMAIQGNASLMLIDVDPSQPHYERLRNIEKQVERGAKLTSQLLGYARRGKYEVKPIDLNRLVEETVETFGRTKKEITIRSELAPDLFAIEANEGQIQQVLFNLYVNAADAMPVPGGGHLIIKTRNATHEDMKDKPYEVKPGKYALLIVTDTGTGMDKKIQERIFEPFFTTKEMGQGTGLGLASVYGIVKSHGGYIDVISRKGHGTTFNVYLPASEEKLDKPVKPGDRIIKGTETILLVDDEEPVLDMGANMLKQLGYTVIRAKSGAEAIEIYETNKHRIDLVVLDMIMPEISGGEVYDRIKEINPNVKGLLSSGYSIEGQATRILERGCDGFIQKPFTEKQLSLSVRRILDKTYQ